MQHYNYSKVRYPRKKNGLKYITEKKRATTKEEKEGGKERENLKHEDFVNK